MNLTNPTPQNVSPNTGLAPVWAIALTVAMNVSGLVITSSPGPISRAIKAISTASVPEDTPMAFGTPR